ncbi:MAG: peptidoglycan DD-metalloendopeptidase family protein [Synergistaceae bacterium]|jgi:murein DD-endopeptidase MepM/ murein hydrolase activator NlpD|nr:peptidoglycan DD-metalloendopeptidase family protein [Synergistaceae bacterium]
MSAVVLALFMLMLPFPSGNVLPSWGANEGTVVPEGSKETVVPRPRPPDLVVVGGPGNMPSLSLFGTPPPKGSNKLPEGSKLPEGTKLPTGTSYAPARGQPSPLPSATSVPAVHWKPAEGFSPAGSGATAPPPVGNPTPVSPFVVHAALKGSDRARARKSLPLAVFLDPRSVLLTWPVRGGAISSSFGERRALGGRHGTRVHEGIDIAVPTGTPVFASMMGLVTDAGVSGGYGKAVTLDHGHGVKTLYAHCSLLTVNKGDWVKEGQIIAYSGNTGFSTAPHLHFGLMIDGVFRDPVQFMLK